MTEINKNHYKIIKEENPLLTLENLYNWHEELRHQVDDIESDLETFFDGFTAKEIRDNFRRLVKDLQNEYHKLEWLRKQNVKFMFMIKDIYNEVWGKENEQ